MGYGLVLIGYLLTFFTSLTLYGWMTRLLGYLVMAYGFYKLKDYFPSYKLSLFSLLAIFLVGLGEAGCEIAKILGGAADAVDPIKNIICYTRDGMLYVFHIFFLVSTCIAFGVVGMNEKKVSAVTDICAVTVGYVFYILSAFGIVEANVAFFVQLIWSIMVTVLILGCYMRICPEGDEDMPRRESKIPFINKFAEALEKRENEAIERTKRDIEEKKKNAANGTHKKRKRRRK
ncbi:MAG: hypothetical protein J6S71_09175 [Clostridia bacterium]|nr:hypothetical protein [Clostridia bacterium]